VEATFRHRLPPLTLIATLNGPANTITGQLLDPLFTPVAHQGFRNKWSAATPPTSFKDAQPYTFALNLPAQAVGQLDFPQGSGFGSFVIDDKAAPTVTGRTADGLTYTSATIMGPDGEIPLHLPFLGRIGSLHGLLDITPGAVAPADNTLSGTLLWSKLAAPTTSSDQVYRNGFAIPGVIATGGKYAAPAPGGVVLALPNSVNNALIEFSEGGLLPTEAPDVILSITNSSATGLTQTITPPAAGTSGNPNGVKLKIDAAKGTFTGEMLIPGTSSALNRKISLQGILVRNGTSGYFSVGHFLVPQLPQPGQTLTTSPVLSGRLDLLPNP
jgi:hypothetical protein